MLVNVDKSVYEGQWSNDVQEGQGCFKWPDGRIYIGEFEFGKRQGKGKMLYENGDRWEGTFKELSQEGEGKHGSGTLVKFDGSEESITYNALKKINDHDGSDR